MGENHILAANKYTSMAPPYNGWFKGWVSTYPDEGSYDPTSAWKDFRWVTQNPTDSAAAATAIYSGKKTWNGRISVSPDGSIRYQTITEDARQRGISVGAVTSVPISHATPGAWMAHNDSRQNGYAIANEGIWGDPNTTGKATWPYYGGGHGITLPPINVLIGGGHPHWYTNQNTYVDEAILQKLLAENNQMGKPSFIERVAGSDGGKDLLNMASNPAVKQLVGIFGGVTGNIEYRLADGSGANPENPTLAEMTRAAIEVLNRNPKGFFLLVEGGAIDFASHRNSMDQMIGEVIDFNQAIQAAIDWVNNPSSAANWSNTLIIVTADHETGYLTTAPNVFPNQPLGEISSRTLQFEKNCVTTCLRASWEDENGNNEIDSGENVYWAWNSNGHTNSLVPIYLKGAIKLDYSALIRGVDPIRGAYIDNTDIYKILKAVIANLIYLPLVNR
ncbi:MAG: alkaline phosphatase [Anaerolineales bacterium]